MTQIDALEGQLEVGPGIRQDLSGQLQFLAPALHRQRGHPDAIFGSINPALHRSALLPPGERALVDQQGPDRSPELFQPSGEPGSALRPDPFALEIEPATIALLLQVKVQSPQFPAFNMQILNLQRQFALPFFADDAAFSFERHLFPLDGLRPEAAAR